MKRNFSVKKIVAIGIGAAVFVILGRFVVIPTGFPNTSFETSYPFLALMGVIYGPVVGGLIGFIGHTLKDMMMYGAWWSWIICSGVIGMIYGLIGKVLSIQDGQFHKRAVLRFNLGQIVGNILVWGLLAPVLDVLIYAEPANKVFVQGVIASITNIISVGVLGTLLLAGYAKTRIQKGSLTHQPEQAKDRRSLPPKETKEETRRPLIEFEHFSFTYASQSAPTLKDISLTIYEGEKVLILGPSGSGKSTFAKCINGLIPHQEVGEVTGKASIAGHSLLETNLFDLSFNVGTVLQDTDGQFIGLSVGEDIAFVLENDQVAQVEMKEQVKHWAQQVDLLEHLNYRPQDLSGGQKQRVSIAGVLINQAPILLLDEPLANLDPRTGQEMIDLLDRIHQDTASTTLIIEHRLEDVLYRQIDRVLVFDEGCLIADQTPSELLQSGLLKEIGVREPLYVSALKYSGIAATDVQHIDQLERLELSVDKSQLETWAQKQPERDRATYSQPLLEIEQLTYQYPLHQKKVLDDISFTIYQGEMLSIVGTNGAGKSTLCKALCGFIQPSMGKMIWKNQIDLMQESIKERADKIGYVMQNPNQMISQKIVFDEVALGLKLRGMDDQCIREKVAKILDICGLSAFTDWPIAALSFGQKKRVTIASILVLDPELLILDEPTAGQDFKHYTEMMQFIEHLHQMGVTILMITHDMHLMLEYTDRTIVLSDGKIIADTTPVEVLTNDEWIRQGSLKETSLFTLAKKLGLSDPYRFTQNFINYDREVRLP